MGWEFEGSITILCLSRRLAAMLRPRHASVDAAQDEASPHAVQFSQFLQTKCVWHATAVTIQQCVHDGCQRA